MRLRFPKASETSLAHPGDLAGVPLETFGVSAKRYVALSGAVGIFDVLRNLAVASILGPYTLGLCTTILAILQLVSHLYGCLIEAIPVALPHGVVEWQGYSSKLVKSTVWNLTFLISCISFLGIVGYGFFFSGGDGEWRGYLFLAGVVMVLEQTRRFVLTCYLADGEVAKMGWLEFAFALLAMATSVVAVWVLDGYGFWLGLIFPYVLVCLYVTFDYLRREIIVLHVSVEEARSILPLGMIVSLASLTYAPFITASRLYLAGTVGVREVGMFILAAIVMAKIAMLPNALTKILLPQLSALLNRKQEIWRAFHLFRRAQIYNLIISCALVVVGSWLLEPAVALLLPGYVPGVRSAEVILLAGIPCSLTHNANAVLLALRRTGTYLKLVVFAFGLQAALFAYLYWSQQASAYSVSVALLAVFTGYAALSNWTVLKIRKGALGTQG